LQQDLVNFSLLNAFSIAGKLDSSLEDYQCQSSISVNVKANSTMLIHTPTSQQRAMIHFDDGSSQFIVKYIYLLDSEGAGAVPITFCDGSFKLIVASNPVDQSVGGKWVDQIGNKQAAPIALSYNPFGLIVESILISNDLINQIFEGTREPIIFVDTSKKDKIQVLLIIFCGGESDDESSLTSTVATISDRNVGARTAKMRNGGVNCSNGLVSQTGLVGHIGLIKLVSLVSHICISGLASFIGFGLISLVSGFSLIGLSSISSLAG
jgi:hypothetical protein